jgi:hypothetical protein
MHFGFHEKYPSFLSDFNQIGFSRYIFEKQANIKFPENSSSCFIRIDIVRTDRTQLTATFLNSAKASKQDQPYDFCTGRTACYLRYRASIWFYLYGFQASESNSLPTPLVIVMDHTCVLRTNKSDGMMCNTGRRERDCATVSSIQ